MVRFLPFFFLSNCEIVLENEKMCIFFYFFMFIIIFFVEENKCDEDVSPTCVPSVDPIEECIEKLHVNRALVEKLKAGNSQLFDKNLKRWVLCFFEKTCVMTPDGVLRQDIVLKDIPDQDKSKIEKITSSCLYQKPHFAVDTAWNYLNCFRAKDPKYSVIANKI